MVAIRTYDVEPGSMLSVQNVDIRVDVRGGEGTTATLKVLGLPSDSTTVDRFFDINHQPGVGLSIAGKGGSSRSSITSSSTVTTSGSSTTTSSRNVIRDTTITGGSIVSSGGHAYVAGGYVESLQVTDEGVWLDGRQVDDASRAATDDASLDRPIELVLEIPEGMVVHTDNVPGLEVETHKGPVRAKNAGDCKIETSGPAEVTSFGSSEILITGANGVSTRTTGSTTIIAKDLTGNVSAEVNGSVTASFRGKMDAVEITGAGSGSVRLSGSADTVRDTTRGSIVIESANLTVASPGASRDTGQRF